MSFHLQMIKTYEITKSKKKLKNVTKKMIENSKQLDNDKRKSPIQLILISQFKLLRNIPFLNTTCNCLWYTLYEIIYRYNKLIQGKATWRHAESLLKLQIHFHRHKTQSSNKDSLNKVQKKAKYKSMKNTRNRNTW